MAKTHLRQSMFEIGIIVMLIFVATAPALVWGWNMLFVLFHVVFLCGIFLGALEVTRRINPFLGTALFGLIVALLGTEVAVFKLTGLHLNSFTLALAFEGNARENIGLPVLLPACLLLVVAISVYLALNRKTRPIRTRLRTLTAAAVIGALSTQLVYAILFFQAAPGVMETRRLLPFFHALHPYYAERLLNPVLGPRPANPFALPKPSGSVQVLAPIPSVTNARNILMIVMDSVRAKDIREDPGLAPNLLSLGHRGQISLKQYSAANCTHFSMFSMFSGKLPTAFGVTRRRAQPVGLIPLLHSNGYNLSSTEALSLDWYGLSDLLLKGADRHVAHTGTAEQRDYFVTETTIDLLSLPTEKPFFHLAYYNGAHFPYGDAIPIDGLVGGTASSYKKAITAVDEQVGFMMSALSEFIRQKDVLVIVTSDHGESISEDGKMGHASSLADEQTIVPFVVLNGGDTPLPASQVNLLAYIRTQLGIPAPQDAQHPVILSNCSQEIPTGFAVFTERGRADFLYEDGFLSPITSPDGTMPAKDSQLHAAKQLVDAIAAN